MRRRTNKNIEELKTLATAAFVGRDGEVVRTAVPAFRTDSPYLAVTPHLLRVRRTGRILVDRSLWSVTHSRSGYVLEPQWWPWSRDMELLANRLAPLGDWSVINLERDWPQETQDRVRAVLTDFWVEHGLA